MHLAIRSFRFTLALALILIALPTLAATPVADVDLGFNNVTWTPQNEFAGLRLTVSGPDGNTWQNSFDANEAPRLDLSALGSAVDGLYTWELRATPIVDQNKMTATSRTSEAGTRVRSNDLPSRDSLVQSGSFRVLNGTIVQPVAEQDAPGLVVDTPGVDSATAGLERATAADNVINDDQIVDGSLCVGMDCVNGENFGFDTLRLKENNLRMHFNDTSNSASFPTRDWRLVANGSGNGDADYFAIEDSGTGRNVFYVESDAPSHALHVDSAGGGRIGIKTSTPAVDIHVVEGNTPTLRLAQDGSDGFTPQTWDIAGNEANFFLRDVTNSSALPFRVFPGTGNDNLVLRNGRVGIGTNNPQASLHVSGTSSTMLVGGSDGSTNLTVQESSGTVMTRSILTLENNGGTGFSLTNTNSGQTWRMDTGVGRFNFTLVGTGTQAWIDASGNMMINGTITTSGSCNMGCDRVFLPEYDLPTIEDHADEMFANSYLPAVGPTPDEGTRFNLSEKTTGMLNELEKAHIYIAQLNDRLKDKEATVDELTARLEALEAALQN